MLKIYLDYYAGIIFTFPLVRGPEPEGKDDVVRERLTSQSGAAGGVATPAGAEENCTTVNKEHIGLLIS